MLFCAMSAGLEPGSKCNNHDSVQCCHRHRQMQCLSRPDVCQQSVDTRSTMGCSPTTDIIGNCRSDATRWRARLLHVTECARATTLARATQTAGNEHRSPHLQVAQQEEEDMRNVRSQTRRRSNCERRQAQITSLSG